MKINFIGIVGMLFVAIMISICHFYRSWDIPWPFVILSTGAFFGIITVWTMEREDLLMLEIEQAKGDYIHYFTPPLYLSFILCSLSLLMDFEGFWSWTLVFLLCVFIGFTTLTFLFSWGLVGFSKLKLNIYGIFGFMLMIFMATMMHTNVSYSYPGGYVQLGNSAYDHDGYKHIQDNSRWTVEDSLPQLNMTRLYAHDDNPKIIDFKHLENLNKIHDYVLERKRVHVGSKRMKHSYVVNTNEMRRDWFIPGIAFNPSLPWFFIIFTTIIFWISLILFSIAKIKDNGKIDIRLIISIYLTYLFFSLSLSINATGFWIWVGIFILCLSTGIGLPFLLIRKIKSKQKI